MIFIVKITMQVLECNFLFLSLDNGPTIFGFFSKAILKLFWLIDAILTDFE